MDTPGVSRLGLESITEDCNRLRLQPVIYLGFFLRLECTPLEAGKMNFHAWKGVFVGEEMSIVLNFVS